MSENEEFMTESSPAGFARLMDYQKRAARLRHRLPGLVFVRTEMELEAALRTYCWGAEQCVEAFPWSRLTFMKTAKQDLPFLLGTQWIRDRYVDVMRAWPATARNARYLYSPRDLAAWLRENFRTTVETVLVPLTLFAKDADAMRRAFLNERQLRMQSIYDGGPLAYRANRLSTWSFLNDLPASAREQLGCWFSDVSEKAAQQNVQFHRAHLIPYEVTLPPGVLPKFFTMPEIGGTRDYPTKEVGNTTFRSFGWAKHEMLNRGVRCIGYTQGLAIGGKAYDQDYEIGLLELMTAERFVRIFGEGALREARWRLSEDLCRWAAPETDFGPGLPPKQLSALLGINYVTNIQVFR
mgnify:CR=1 FL=1